VLLLNITALSDQDTDWRLFSH